MTEALMTARGTQFNVVERRLHRVTTASESDGEMTLVVAADSVDAALEYAHQFHTDLEVDGAIAKVERLDGAAVIEQLLHPDDAFPLADYFRVWFRDAPTAAPVPIIVVADAMTTAVEMAECYIASLLRQHADERGGDIRFVIVRADLLEVDSAMLGVSRQRDDPAAEVQAPATHED